MVQVTFSSDISKFSGFALVRPSWATLAQAIDVTNLFGSLGRGADFVSGRQCKGNVQLQDEGHSVPSRRNELCGFHRGPFFAVLPLPGSI